MALVALFRVVDFLTGATFAGLEGVAFASRRAALVAAPRLLAQLGNRHAAYRVIRTQEEVPVSKPSVTVAEIRALATERPHLSFSIEGLLDRSIVQLHASVLRVQLGLYAKHLAEFLPDTTAEGLVDFALAYRQWDAASHAVAHEAYEAEYAAQEARKQARKDAIAAASSWLLDGNKFAGRCRCCRDSVRVNRGYYDRRTKTTICDSCLDGVLGLAAPALARAETPKAAPVSDRGWWSRECASDRDA